MNCSALLCSWQGITTASPPPPTPPRPDPALWSCLRLARCPQNTSTRAAPPRSSSSSATQRDLASRPSGELQAARRHVNSRVWVYSRRAASAASLPSADSKETRLWQFWFHRSPCVAAPSSCSVSSEPLETFWWECSCDPGWTVSIREPGGIAVASILWCRGALKTSPSPSSQLCDALCAQ